MLKNEYRVSLINNKDAYPFLLEIHYAKRIPSISYCYGLFYEDELVGVVTYGTPPSHTLRIGIAGKENSKLILELNRLCLKYNKKNEASFLVSKSLKMIKGKHIIVSFADNEQNHIGTVYQACNFRYCGLSAKRTDWKIKGMEHLHGQTIADMSRGMKDRAKYMRELYGDNFYLKERSRKHRYIYITGKNKDYNIIKYKQLPYPKKEA
jgi:hypothetical protein